MISLRFGPATCVLLALALVPVARHEYIGARATDGRQTGAIPLRLAGLAGEALTDRPWIGGAFASDDWIDRRYAGPGGAEISLFAARSYDFKRLYHHPELSVLRGIDLESQPAATVPGVPWTFQVLAPPDNSRQGRAAYVLLYGGEPVGDPYLFQLRTTWELLVRAPQPMTLLFAYDASAASEAPLGDTTLFRVLTGAVRGFLDQVSPGDK